MSARAVFSYGSNLDLPDVRRWARANGHDERVRSLGLAYLPDHRLAYHYWSPGRQGGALDVVPARGACVPGALVEAADVRMLDGKEGADLDVPRYERVACTVALPDGRLRPSETYRVCADFVRADFVAPTEDYASIVARGCAQLGVDAGPAARTATGEVIDAYPGALFVYGTLKRGHCRAGLLERGPVREVCSASVAGQLVDLGAYPGLRLPPGQKREGVVRGELWRLGDLPERLAELDEVEDFLGYDPDSLARSMYERTLVQVEVPGGRSTLAWTYVYRGHDGQPIPSGQWTGE